MLTNIATITINAIDGKIKKLFKKDRCAKEFKSTFVVAAAFPPSLITRIFKIMNPEIAPQLINSALVLCPILLEKTV
jgi:hypothetical protein